MLGVHTIIELYGCDPELLQNEAALSTNAVASVVVAEIAVLNIYVRARRTDGNGVTVNIAHDEGHLSIHTWPEHHYAAADVFAGSIDKGRLVLGELARSFSPISVDLLETPRGERFGARGLEPTVQWQFSDLDPTK